LQYIKLVAITELQLKTQIKKVDILISPLLLIILISFY
jgi:hypothetical protein